MAGSCEPSRHALYAQTPILGTVVPRNGPPCGAPLPSRKRSSTALPSWRCQCRRSRRKSQKWPRPFSRNASCTVAKILEMIKVPQEQNTDAPVSHAELAVSSCEARSSVPVVAKSAGEARPLGISEHSASTEPEIGVSSDEAGSSWPGVKNTAGAAAAPPAKSVGEARPTVTAEYSATAKPELATSRHDGKWVEERLAQTMEATSKMDQRSFQEFVDQVDKLHRASHQRHKSSRKRR